MKLKILFLTLFVAGVVASMAVAKPPPGHGNPHGRNGDAGSTNAGSTAASTSTSTTATLPSSGKVVLCHHTGSKSHPWVRISVNVHAARTRLRKGDQLAAADGSCGASTTGTTTTGTTTTGTTTTGTTTTVATTTTAPTTTTTP